MDQNSEVLQQILANQSQNGPAKDNYSVAKSAWKKGMLPAY